MARFFFIIFLCFPILAAAAEIDSYVPPPMFETTEHSAGAGFPPLPPKRPGKINVPKSYIEHLKKHGKPPKIELERKNPKYNQEELLYRQLVKPTAQDILEQINPQ